MEWIEQAILFAIILLTVGAVGFECYSVYQRQEIVLADLLLFFIYAEVIAMVKGFMKSKDVPVLYPIFIAITALSRLIILQGKDMDPVNIFYEAISIFVLALAILVISYTQGKDPMARIDKEKIKGGKS